MRTNTKILDLKMTRLQKLFIESKAFITLYGGSAGGGKSYGLLLKSIIRCLMYPGYKCLILRRTFPELKRSMILTALSVIPKAYAKYRESEHALTFLVGGSRIEFGYCENDSDLQKYQSAEYDSIGFDESTHFAESQIIYMISRIRGANNFPKSLDLTTNPGGLSHDWHKKTFIDTLIPNVIGRVKINEKELDGLFIPAKATDNMFLVEKDPQYIENLKALPEKERRQLLDGDWDYFSGSFFPEFDKSVHVVQPFDIPYYWRKFRCLDYGLDMTACYWVAIDPAGKLYVYRELYQPGLTLSKAAKKILDMTPKGEDIQYTVASRDLWNRNKQTGKAEMETLTENGLRDLKPADNRRVPGWRQMREWLQVYDSIDPVTETPIRTASIAFFDTCHNIIRCMPILMPDKHECEDVSDTPHEITHGPESLRYGIMSRPPKGRTETDYMRHRKLRDTGVAIEPTSKVTGW